MHIVYISVSVYELLKRTVGTYLPESGAIIGSHIGDSTHITKVWFDQSAGYGKKFYSPSCDEIYSVVKSWIEKQQQFVGIIHSHNDGFPLLSPLNVCSASAIMRANQLHQLYLGLFHQGELSMFEVHLNDDSTSCRVEKVECVIDYTLF